MISDWFVGSAMEYFRHVGDVPEHFHGTERVRKGKNARPRGVPVYAGAVFADGTHVGSWKGYPVGDGMALEAVRIRDDACAAGLERLVIADIEAFARKHAVAYVHVELERSVHVERALRRSGIRYSLTRDSVVASDTY